MAEKLIYKLTFYFFWLILLILPFWPAKIELLVYHTSLNSNQIFLIKIFYEFILIILFLFTIFNPGWERHRLKLKLVDWLVLIYLFWAVASIFISGETLSQGIQGLRYNGLFLGFYLLGRYSFFSEHRVKVLDRLIVVVGEIIAVWSILEVLIFKSGYWQRWGLLPVDSSFGFGSYHQVVSVPQAMATLEGPNQLGSYLLVPFFLLLSKKVKKHYDWLFILIIALAILLSFSRSAILGLAIGFVVYLFVAKNESVGYRSALGLTLIGLVALAVWYFGQQGGLMRDFFTHGSSSIEHYRSMLMTFKGRSLTDLLIGQGIGTAGPASFNFKPTVQESWYLQVLSEIGIIGLGLWLGIIILMVIDYLKRDLGLVLALISTSVAAFFLHTFADNPPLSISLFLLLGVYCSTNFREAKH